MKNHNSENWVMALLFIFAVIVPLGFIIMVLWNVILIPVLQEGVLHPIGFWQALGLLLLFRLLIGGVPSDWFKKRSNRHKFQDKRLLDKWKSMTGEEKEQFLQQWHTQPTNTSESEGK